MTPYYDDGTCVIYHGDCREIDAWLTADVLITDPPYGIGWKIGAGIGNDIHGASITGDESTDVRDTALRLWGEDRPWLMFGSLRAALPPRWRQTIVFHKACHNAGLVGVRRPWRNNWEPIFVGGTWPDQTPRTDAVVRTHEMAATGYSGYVTRAGHPHAKPVDVLTQLIDACPPGVVADPFMGSGTTLRAAKDLGRHAIGVELEERYCEIAAKRLGQEILDFGGVA
jgi:DNA methylase